MMCKICALCNTTEIKKTGAHEDIYSVHVLENSIKLHFVETADVLKLQLPFTLPYLTLSCLCVFNV